MSEAVSVPFFRMTENDSNGHEQPSSTTTISYEELAVTSDDMGRQVIQDGIVVVENHQHPITPPTHQDASKRMTTTTMATTTNTRTSGRQTRKTRLVTVTPHGSAVPAVIDGVVSPPSSVPTPTQQHKPRGRPKSTPTSKNADGDREFESRWICSGCREAECMMKPEADQLLICEGVCRRLFHYPCAGLETLPTDDEPYICDDCIQKKHVCCICNAYGEDDVDVFACKSSKCGLFFHESCLEMQNVEVHIVQDQSVTDDEDRSKGKRLFLCPAHSCWTCNQTELLEADATAEPEDKERDGRKSGKGRKKRKRVSNTVFAPKNEITLVRCLECPISYHVSCIPPCAKFHELALLCHEHSESFKLPYLDAENSFQSKIEAKADKYAAMSSRPKRRHHYGNNSFFPLQGAKLTTMESALMEVIPDDVDDQGLLKELNFCLPCDLRDEVHTKPPGYRHVHSLQYDPKNKPPRITRSGAEQCDCIGHCGESCFNRITYTECVGDGSKNSNCNVGPDCGNRQVTQRKYPKCKPLREQGKGWGLVTIEKVEKGRLVQEYIGEVIDEATKQERLGLWTIEHPNDPNFYIMALTRGWYIDARDIANLSRFINHSCDPNCDLVPINVGGYMRNAIIAKRDIAPGEFLSYDYRFDTKQGDRFVCRCGAAICRGTMKEGKNNVDVDTTAKTAAELWEDAKARLDKDKALINEFYTREEDLRKISEFVPGYDNADELVANGPIIRSRGKTFANRVFLRRNVVLGSRFDLRFIPMEKR